VPYFIYIQNYEIKNNKMQAYFRKWIKIEIIMLFSASYFNLFEVGTTPQATV
jgi:hypothetical protein